MKNIFTHSCVALLAGSAIALLSACQDNQKVLPSCDGAHWEYAGIDGPGHWQDLCVGYGACAGTVQSPVDLGEHTDDATLSAIVSNYSGTQTHIFNNGHTLQFNQDAGSSITFEGQTYDLLQFHVHTPSEHTLNGQYYPMEIHLVHQNQATGQLAVIGVLIEEGVENAFLTPFTGHLPSEEEEHYESADTYNIAGLLPADLTYLTYPGSLTTPPCSETVSWIVLENPVQASLAQINKFGQIIHRNNRPTQQLNGRVVRHFHQ